MSRAPPSSCRFHRDYVYCLGLTTQDYERHSTDPILVTEQRSPGQSQNIFRSELRVGTNEIPFTSLTSPRSYQSKLQNGKAPPAGRGLISTAGHRYHRMNTRAVDKGAKMQAYRNTSLPRTSSMLYSRWNTYTTDGRAFGTWYRRYRILTSWLPSRMYQVWNRWPVSCFLAGIQS